MTPAALLQLLMPIIAALVYSGVFFFKKYVDFENEKSLRETFDARKFGVTLGIGVLVAGVMLALGQPIQMGSMMEMLLLYEGVIMSADQALKAFMRGNEKRARKHAKDAGREAATTTASYYYSHDRDAEVQPDADTQNEEEEVIEDGP